MRYRDSKPGMIFYADDGYYSIVLKLEEIPDKPDSFNFVWLNTKYVHKHEMTDKAIFASDFKFIMP